MKEKLLILSNFGLYIIAIGVSAAAQTALWMQVFGSFPPPAIWMPIVIYFALNNPLLQTALFSYAAALALRPATVTTDGILMISILCVSVVTQVFKTRIYWNASTYFMLLSGVGTLVFHVCNWILDSTFGDLAFALPKIDFWLIQSLLTPLVVPFLIPICRWFDALTRRDLLPEAIGSM